VTQRIIVDNSLTITLCLEPDSRQKLLNPRRRRSVEPVDLWMVTTRESCPEAKSMPFSNT
jgi:hypothetical protein